MLFREREKNQGVSLINKGVTSGSLHKRDLSYTDRSYQNDEIRVQKEKVKKGNQSWGVKKRENSETRSV